MRHLTRITAVGAQALLITAMGATAALAQFDADGYSFEDAAPETNIYADSQTDGFDGEGDDEFFFEDAEPVAEKSDDFELFEEDASDDEFTSADELPDVETFDGAPDPMVQSDVVDGQIADDELPRTGPTLPALILPTAALAMLAGWMLRKRGNAIS